VYFFVAIPRLYSAIITRRAVCSIRQRRLLPSICLSVMFALSFNPAPAPANLSFMALPTKAWCGRQNRAGRVGWAIAQSPILNTTITVARLTQRGCELLQSHYLKVSPHHQSSPLFSPCLTNHPVRARG